MGAQVVALPARACMVFGHPNRQHRPVAPRPLQVAGAHPALLFVVLGEPHPACGPLCAEHYNALRAQAEALGLARHVSFVGGFASEAELPAAVQVGSS